MLWFHYRLSSRFIIFFKMRIKSLSFNWFNIYHSCIYHLIVLWLNGKDYWCHGYKLYVFKLMIIPSHICHPINHIYVYEIMIWSKKKKNPISVEIAHYTISMSFLSAIWFVYCHLYREAPKKMKPKKLRITNGWFNNINWICCFGKARAIQSKIA